MAAAYYYLIAGLPMLSFGQKPPFSFGRFLEISRQHVTGVDARYLELVSIAGGYSFDGGQKTLEAWQRFDTQIRNEIVRLRASHRKLDPQRFMRGEYAYEAQAVHAVTNAHRSGSILEGERLLDQERWRFLDELANGHHFDIDFLIVYGLKLLILERWDRMIAVNKDKALAQTLAPVTGKGHE